LSLILKPYINDYKAPLQSLASLEIMNRNQVICSKADIRTFAITGGQKQSEAALLHIRVDGVVRVHYAAPTISK